MDAEEGVAAASTPTCFSKAPMQCKLLETIFEDPKHSADGKERLTSVRKYKRFIDFTVGATASKKWKRSQKARKLAVNRQSPIHHPQGHPEVLECTQDVFARSTQRKTRLRIPTSTYQNGADHTFVARDRKPAGCNHVNNGVCETADRMCDDSSQSELGAWVVCNNSSFEPDPSSGLPDTFIVSGGDLFVEEAATVELPLGCMSNDYVGVDMEVRSSIENLLTAVVSSKDCCSWGNPSVCVGDVKHSELCDGEAAVASRVSDELNEARPRAEPRKAQSRIQTRVPTRKSAKKNAVWSPKHPVDRGVEGTVSELIAIIEATDTLCERVVGNCSLSSCNMDSEIVNQLLHSFVERVPENVP